MVDSTNLGSLFSSLELGGAGGHATLPVYIHIHIHFEVELGVYQIAPKSLKSTNILSTTCKPFKPYKLQRLTSNDLPALKSRCNAAGLNG